MQEALKEVTATESAEMIVQKTQIEADTAVIRAEGKAEAIRIRADAIRDNPGWLQLQIVESGLFLS